MFTEQALDWKALCKHNFFDKVFFYNFFEQFYLPWTVKYLSNNLQERHIPFACKHAKWNQRDKIKTNSALSRSKDPPVPRWPPVVGAIPPMDHWWSTDGHCHFFTLVSIITTSGQLKLESLLYSQHIGNASLLR